MSDADLTAALRKLAADAAPMVVEAALKGACADAEALLRERLVAAIMEEAAASPAEAVEVPVPAARPTAHVSARSTGCPSGSRAEHVYVYGLVRGRDASGVAAVGVDARTVYSIDRAGFAAIASDVRGDVAAAPGASVAAPPDLAALTPRLEAHERVLEHLLEVGPVLPMRFGRLYPSRSAVGGMLAANAEGIEAALRRVEGSCEWGLNVSWDPRLDLPPANPGPAAGGGEPREEGRSYLERRKAERAAEQVIAERRSALCTRVHRAVSSVARDSVVHPVVRNDGSDAPERLLRASYLVSNVDRERFETAILECLEACSGVGMRGELTGPWPPYNFCSLELVETRA